MSQEVKNDLGSFEYGYTHFNKIKEIKMSSRVKGALKL